METIKTLIDEETKDERIKELASEISKDYKDKNPVIVCILKGAVYFFTDLTRRLDIDCELDFMRISSYKGHNSTGKIDIKIDISSDIENRDVLIVEDIFDTGVTMVGLYNHLLKKHPNSIKLCVFLDKPEGRKVHDVSPDYIGFTIPPKFVIGYGLDDDEKYRNLPNVSCVTDESDEEIDKQRELIKRRVNKKNVLH